MMPNKTYELRNVYLQQSQYSAEQAKSDYPLLLQSMLKERLEIDRLNMFLPPVEEIDFQTKNCRSSNSGFFLLERRHPYKGQVTKGLKRGMSRLLGG